MNLLEICMGEFILDLGLEVENDLEVSLEDKKI